MPKVEERHRTEATPVAWRWSFQIDPPAWHYGPDDPRILKTPHRMLGDLPDLVEPLYAATVIAEAEARGAREGREKFADLYAELNDSWLALSKQAVADEREAAAKIAEEYAQEKEEDAEGEPDPDYKERFLVYAKHVRRVAAAIRARSNQ